jgi:hypothetical protein
MAMTQQFWTELPGGSPHDAQSAFALQELGHDPASHVFPLDALPPPSLQDVLPEEAPLELLMSPDACELCELDVVCPKLLASMGP